MILFARVLALCSLLPLACAPLGKYAARSAHVWSFSLGLGCYQPESVCDLSACNGGIIVRICVCFYYGIESVPPANCNERQGFNTTAPPIPHKTRRKKSIEEHSRDRPRHSSISIYSAERLCECVVCFLVCESGVTNSCRFVVCGAFV